MCYYPEEAKNWSTMLAANYMRKKRQHLFFLVLLSLFILLPTIKATLNDSALVFYVSYDSTVNDIKNAAVGTDSGTSAALGKLGNARYFDGTNDYITYPNDDDLDMGSNDFTMGCWINISNAISSSGSYLSKCATWESSIDYDLASYHGGTSGNWEKQTFSRNNYHFNSGTQLSKGAWHLIIASYDYIGDGTSNITWYIDNAVDGAATNAKTGTANDEVMVVGDNSCQGYAVKFKGTIDECFIYKAKILTAAERAALWNSGSGCNPVTTNCDGAAPPATPSLSLKTNLANNLKINDDPFVFYFNGTTAYTPNNNFNCTLRLNSTISGSKIPANINLNQNFTIVTTGWERGYNINVTCRNTNASDSFKKTGIYFDTINPVLKVYEFNHDGIYYSDTDYDLNISMSDSNLAGYNFTIWKNISNVLTKVYSRFYASLVGGTYWLTNLTNSSQWCPSEPCNMKQKTVIWDDHNPITGTHEQAKSIITNGSKLIMQFKTGQVSIESPTIQKYTITDKDNKYALDFQFTKQGSQTIILKNPSQWIFRNTEHKAHFYSPYVMKYFDLDNPDITISKITKMSDGFYIDIVTKDAVLKTNSIGDLNVVTNYTYFTILERPDLNTALLTDINQSLANLNANVDDLITETRRGSNMYLLIFLPALLGLFAIIGATTLGREHTPLKIALFLFSFISVLGSAWLGTSIIGDLDSNVQDTLGQFVFYGGIIIVILFSYFMLYFVYKFFQAAAQSKDDKLEY